MQLIDLRDRSSVPEFGSWSANQPNGTRNFSIFTNHFLRKGDLLIKAKDGEPNSLTLWQIKSVDLYMGQNSKDSPNLWKGVITDVIYNNMLTDEMVSLLKQHHFA